MSNRLRTATLLVFYSAVAITYFVAAARQKTHVNLSATAGGQYPYLQAARLMATEGGDRYFGDRNRMPLYPALLSIVYSDDWGEFVNRAGWFAIVSSALLLIGLGAVFQRTLPALYAAALVAVAAFDVFLGKASFVQAELLYYSLFLVGWLSLCRVLSAPTPARGALAGLLVGATFLAKASALPMMVAFVAVALVTAIVAAYRALRRTRGGADKAHRRWVDLVLSTGAAIAVFGLVVGPYCVDSNARFGRYFYNVNSTFFMWCDSWDQAKSFADRHTLDRSFPAADERGLPSAAGYWRTHTGRQMLRRVASGLRTLAGRAVWNPYFKYIVIAGVLCGATIARRRRLFRDGGPCGWAVVIFSLLLGAGYLCAYAWYAQVAFGERFVLSLVLPTLFGLVWLRVKLRDEPGAGPDAGSRVAGVDALAVGLALLAAVDGVMAAAHADRPPTPEFVNFYYNESHERLLAGDFAEAERGFEGGTTLDPTHAASWHGLGMVRLAEGRFDGAVEPLARAAQLAPRSADIHNSLGSALLQSGRPAEALPEFLRATELEPEFATAWFNLGGCYWRLGALDEAWAVQVRLAGLDEGLAARLKALLESG